MRIPSLSAKILFLVTCLGLWAQSALADIPRFDVNPRQFRKRVGIIGALTYNQTAGPVQYTARPRFLAYTFRGAAGDRVDVWVRSPDGDAVAWLLDDRLRVAAAADDEDDSDESAHLELYVPRAGVYYVVFRDIDFVPAGFTVTLQGGPAAQACPPGQRWEPRAGRCVGQPPSACPPGLRWDPNIRRCVSQPAPVCPQGQYWDGDTGRCVSGPTPLCAPNQRWDATLGRCVVVQAPACPQGQRWDEQTGRCVSVQVPTCPPRQRWDEQTGRCVLVLPPACPPGQYWDEQTNRCVLAQAPTCPPGQRWDEQAGRCVYAQAPTCPPGQRWDEQTGRCVYAQAPTCPAGQRWDEQTGRCVYAQAPTCPPGQRWDEQTRRCVSAQTPPCPPGQRWDPNLGRCAEEYIFCGGIAARPCPQGYQCVDDPRDDCDPRYGGRDCGGVCTPASQPVPQQCTPTQCDPYQHWDQASCRCVDNPRCGPSVGTRCPEGSQCYDDPRDNCDPRRGDRGCVGVCL